MSDRQPETDARHDTIVVEGDDADHVQPPQELDPFTPEPSPPPHGRAALWIALAVLAVMVVVVLVAVIR
jgi:hypothetical protein